MSASEIEIFTSLIARLRTEDREWIVRRSYEHHFSVPRLTGALVECAVAACQEDPNLLREILSRGDR